MPIVRRRRKRWHEMTPSEIVATLIASTVIGGAIVSIIVYQILSVPEWSPWLLLWPVPGIVFVLVAVGVGYLQAFRELKRQAKSH